MGKAIVIVVLIVIVCVGLKLGLGGCGTGNGSSKGAQILNAITKEKKNEEIIIKVEENKIYVGEDECKDVEDLKEKIKIINSKGENKIYFFEHEDAIKATYDEVKKALIDLEETLGISFDNKEY